MRHVHREQQALGFGALFVGNADMKEHRFQVRDRDFDMLTLVARIALMDGFKRIRVGVLIGHIECLGDRHHR